MILDLILLKMADNRTYPIVCSNSSIIQDTRSPSNELLSPTIDQTTSMNNSTNAASNQYAIQHLRSSYGNHISQRPSMTDPSEYDKEGEIIHVCSSFSSFSILKDYFLMILPDFVFEASKSIIQYT